ncbi:MAG: DUF4815 domain-containing protein [Sphaerobacter sp.]|nr:DUF4815 domain-containing protein [Sphaerobacter sp.]
MGRTWLRALLGLSLLASLIIGPAATARAAPEEPGQPTLYFPWVPYHDALGGIDGITGAITVQNLEVFPVDVTVTDAAGRTLARLTLNPRAAQTWDASELGLPEPGAGVIASATWHDLDDLAGAGLCAGGSTVVSRGSQRGTVDTATLPAPAPRTVDAVSVTQGGKVFAAGVDFTWEYRHGQLAIVWSPKGAEPNAGSSYTLTYRFACPLPRIAGVEKHTVGTVGVRTTSATAAVDGYSAIPAGDVALAGNGGAPLEGQSRWVVPIVQTNNGWNSVLVITNVSGKPTSVSATFYAAGGQGFAGPSAMLLSGKTLKAGETVRVDLRADAGFPEGAVGAVWVDATHAVVAAAFRVKPVTGMLLTTVGQPRTDDGAASPTEKFGPLVFRDYNGWNTGINVANLASVYNQVTVTYYNYSSNVVAAEMVTIPPRAMEYVYIPATGSFGLGESQVTAVRIAGTAPLVAAIDEVKYLGGQGQGHALSYPASRAQGGGREAASAGTPVNGRVLYEALLALPLVQKGNPSTGMGDTSGINLFNPSGAAVEAWVQFVDPSGVPVAPTVAANDAEAPLRFPLPAGAGATLSTLNLSEQPAGLVGSAVVGAVGAGTLVGVSNNVNHAVGGDGSAVYSLAVTSHASPRFFRTFAVSWGPDAQPVTDEQGTPPPYRATVTVSDQFQDPLPGVPVQLAVQSGPNAGRVVSATTDGAGQATLAYASNGALGLDTLEVWVDGDRDGVRDPGERETRQTSWTLGLSRALAVEPASASAPVGTAHTVTVRVTDGSAARNPVPGVAVACALAAGSANAAVAAAVSGPTGADGTATCSWTGANPGRDTLTVAAAGQTAAATIDWLAGGP